MGNAAWSQGLSALVKNKDDVFLEQTVTTFSSKSQAKLRTAIEQLTAEGVDLSPNQLDNVRNAFDAIDANKNGSIELEEFASALEVIGMKISSEDCESVFKTFFVNGKFQFDDYLLLVKEGLVVSGSDFTSSKAGALQADESFKIEEAIEESF